MKEATSSTEIVNSILDAGWFAHKLTDTPRVPGMLRFIPPKPCDILSCIHGMMVGIETKQIKKWQGFALRFLRENQIEALTKINKAGGHAFIFLNVRIPPDKEANQKRENRLIIIDWSTWDRLPINIIKIKDVQYVTGKNGRFDLTAFFNHIGEKR